MPKNPFQRPHPISHSHNVPRHGQQQQQLRKLQVKPRVSTEKSGLPPLEKLLGSEQRH